jgi:putative phosphoesterase
MMSGSGILVLSDSHGCLPALKAALLWAAGKDLNAAVFLGDGAADTNAASTETGFCLPWYKVAGNGDFGFSLPESMILETDAGRKFFLSHGSRYHVESGFRGIAAAARAAGAAGALFGHTHVPFLGEQDGVFLLNPGSAGRPRSRAGASFAVLDCFGPPAARFFGLIRRGQDFVVRELEI